MGFNKAVRLKVRSRIRELIKSHSRKEIAEILVREGFKKQNGDPVDYNFVGNQLQNMGVRTHRKKRSVAAPVTAAPLKRVSVATEKRALIDLIFDLKVDKKSKMQMIESLL